MITTTTTTVSPQTLSASWTLSPVPESSSPAGPPVLPLGSAILGKRRKKQARCAFARPQQPALRRDGGYLPTDGTDENNRHEQDRDDHEGECRQSWRGRPLQCQQVAADGARQVEHETASWARAQAPAAEAKAILSPQLGLLRPAAEANLGPERQLPPREVLETLSEPLSRSSTEEL
eukprot:CAMPEP_0115164622 /NCGR_PEP_ID=MMETSP0227-20121206/73133_1 /TAXON_ID=89957 /ORGANISM="Polarella glacialis, Strain CCMP 1383" /LENGTH=176 /DNA_ID=CAMNT_0002576991 /DNA_START=11 /DNA_END=541 /DNA_ORIENTATION=+